MWADIDVCIKSYLRPKALDRLLRSIERFYPQAGVTVNHHPELHTGRNMLVAATSRPFLLFLDDDFEFTADTRIDLLYAEMADVSIGVAGGVVMDVVDGFRTQRNSGGLLTIKDGALRLDTRLRGGLESKWTDVVPNFCLIRRTVFETCSYRWGIGAEHADFFMQIKQAGWKVCQIDACKIDHHPFSPALAGYKQARWNIAEPIAAFLNHWGLQRVVVNGKVVHSLPEVPCVSR